jgi:hypothetical protein
MPPPQLTESLQLLEQYAFAEDRSRAAEELSSQLGGKTSAFLAGALVPLAARLQLQSFWRANDIFSSSVN